jgi:hypothetical protein
MGRKQKAKDERKRIELQRLIEARKAYEPTEQDIIEWGLDLNGDEEAEAGGRGSQGEA